MDRVKIRAKNPVAEFLCRFRLGHRQRLAARPEGSDKIVIREDGQTDDHLPSPEHRLSVNPLYSKCPGTTTTGLSADQECSKGRSGDKGSPPQSVAASDAGKGEQVITYTRRARTGGKKRKSPDGLVLDGPQDESDLGADSNGFINDYNSYTSGKMCAKTIQEAESFSPAKSPSTIKTWKKLTGPQKTLAPKRVIGQYFLDLGQSDFSYSTCSICGLFYARGQPKDEKVHKTFHKNFTQGIQFKGWHGERVASRLDHEGNRVIIVLAEDTHHQRKVREVIEVMEAELGLTPGWLLERSCKVYFFISSSKRIVGCLMAEPINSAFRVVSAECQSSGKAGEPILCEKEEKNRYIRLAQSCHLARDTNYSGLDRSVSEHQATGIDENGEREHGSFNAEEAHFKKASLTGYPEDAIPAVCPSPMHVPGTTMSSPEQISKEEVVLYRSDTIKQEAAPVRDVLKTPKITEFFTAKTSHVEKLALIKSEWDVNDSQLDVKGTCLMATIDGKFQPNGCVLGQDTDPGKEEEGFPFHVTDPMSKEAEGKEKPSVSSGRNMCVVQDGNSKEGGKPRTNFLLFGNVKFSREMALRKQVSQEQTGDLGRAILCTKTPVPAVCGVRVIWVSQSQRRKGIASHLLDAMRKSFCLGVVLEPSQFAFSQPTAEGRKFAGRYCKTNEFLVYTTS